MQLTCLPQSGPAHDSDYAALLCSNGSQSLEEKTATSTLDLRQAVRQNFMAGQVDEVACLLKQHLPRLLEAEGGDSKPDLDVYFHVNVMHFIELIRCPGMPSFNLSNLWTPLASII